MITYQLIKQKKKKEKKLKKLEEELQYARRYPPQQQAHGPQVPHGYAQGYPPQSYGTPLGGYSSGPQGGYPQQHQQQQGYGAPPQGGYPPQQQPLQQQQQQQQQGYPSQGYGGASQGYIPSHESSYVTNQTPQNALYGSQPQINYSPNQQRSQQNNLYSSHGAPNSPAPLGHNTVPGNQGGLQNSQQNVTYGAPPNQSNNLYGSSNSLPFPQGVPPQGSLPNSPAPLQGVQGNQVLQSSQQGIQQNVTYGAPPNQPNNLYGSSNSLPFPQGVPPQGSLPQGNSYVRTQ